MPGDVEEKPLCEDVSTTSTTARCWGLTLPEVRQGCGLSFRPVPPAPHCPPAPPPTPLLARKVKRGCGLGPPPLPPAATAPHPQPCPSLFRCLFLPGGCGSVAVSGISGASFHQGAGGCSPSAAVASFSDARNHLLYSWAGGLWNCFFEFLMKQVLQCAQRRCLGSRQSGTVYARPLFYPLRERGGFFFFFLVA